jgi:hypothetical protein
MDDTLVFTGDPFDTIYSFFMTTKQALYLSCTCLTLSQTGKKSFSTCLSLTISAYFHIPVYHTNFEKSFVGNYEIP